MSWEFVIDTIKEWVLSLGYATQAWVRAQGYLTTGFVDRGDPASNDFAGADFTKDNNWHNLDLSGIVPAGAKAVLVRALCTSTSINRSFLLRKDGNANSINWVQYRCTVANVPYTADAVCPISTARKLEYRVTHTDLYTIYLTVKGWWL